MESRLDGSVLDSFTQRLGRDGELMTSRRLIEDRPVTRMWRRIEVNFTYRGIIGGDSTSQINLWRRGKKHVAVFDEGLSVRPRHRTNRESSSTGHLERSSRPNGKQCHHLAVGRRLDRPLTAFCSKRGNVSAMPGRYIELMR